MEVLLDPTCELRPLGLSSISALSLLHSQLSTVLQEYKQAPKPEGQAAWRRNFLHHSVRWSCLHWPGALLTALCAASLLACHAIDLNSDNTTLIGGCALLLLLLGGLVSMATLQHLKSSEMPHRVDKLLNSLQEVLQHPPPDWLGDTEDLFMPFSPTVSLQWTYRDGRLINLPVSLLVEGDVISLRPGSEAPTELRGIQEEEHIVLSHRDVFRHTSHPPSPRESEMPRPHPLLQPQLFRVTRTPAVEVVQRCLELSEHRPVSVLDNERFVVQSLLERGPAPLTLVLLLVLNMIRYVMGVPGVGPWPVALLQLPVNGILPLLPLTFPLLWILLGMYSEVCVLLLMGQQPAHWLERMEQTCRTFLSVLTGQSPTLCHTASLLQSLGSVTVLCCVDKEGILSCPSPRPEKILFFSRAPSSREAQRLKQKDKNMEDSTSRELIQTRGLCGLEMLSLSAGQAHLDDMWVQFDDTQWPRHATSLRPLGLAVHLLQGDSAVAAQVLRLCDHLTHAALLRTRPPCQPVRPPSGLSQLPNILGFSPSAHESFKQKVVLAAYTPPRISCPGEVTVTAPPPVSRRRLPFSHLFALLVQHVHTGELHLFSYGSADVILGVCTEFWDGETLQTMTDMDRKKVIDFYQRSCMIGQCVAVAFKPFLQDNDPAIDAVCVELPLQQSPAITENPPLPHLGEQVFLGLLSSQFQARLDIVRLIAGLDSACIRFVYFSNEEEVRSKVFAEKLGLETGWNCHVSLQPERFPVDPCHVPLQPESFPLDPQQGGIPKEDSCLLGESSRKDAESWEVEPDAECLTEDLNRAKLPKGIENVRPHLEHIDNVPLLVPLFTDCTSQTVCEMVRIMQEYGEVVCCLGSSQNFNNSAIFVQSDISIALEPLWPVRFWSSPDVPERSPHSSLASAGLRRLSGAICGLACTLQLSHGDSATVIKLIKQARHATAGIRKCFLFLLQCQLLLVLLQIMAGVCQLPPPLATSDVLLLSAFYFPLLSVSLLGKASDSSIMKVPTGKNLRFLPKKTLRFFALCFLVKFGLTVCVYLTCFGFLLHGFCLEINHEDKDLCHPTTLLTNSTVRSPDWYGKHFDGLCLAEKVIACLVLLCATCTSASHVHRSAPMWKQSPLSNHSWCAVVCTILVLSVSIATGSRFLWHDPSPHHTLHIRDVPMATWLLGVLWLLPLVFINEGIKLHEIRMRVRYQKRQKLQFDTKLGMNSPF